MSVVLAGTVRFAPDRLDAARTQMIEMMRLSRAEDGCVAYVYSEDLLEAGLVHVFEVWRDQAALDGHHAAAHFLRWREQREDLGMSDRRLVAYQVASSGPA